MEQNADAGTPVVPAVENKQKSGNGLKIATAIACFVAVCGIGFGTWMMINKNAQVDDLNEQITSLKVEIDSLEKQKEELESKIQFSEEQDSKKSNEQTISFENSTNTWPVTASLVGDEIHFINNDGEIVKIDSSYSFVKIKECQTLEEDRIVRCAVETTYDTNGDNDRGVIYHGDNGKLEHWSASGW